MESDEMLGDAWIAAWLDGVARGEKSMSQRVLTGIDAHGGLDRAIAAAKLRGIHLVELTDEKGRIVVAASLRPFRALC